MTDLYKLLLVDDEPWALTGMEEIIDWEAEGFKVAGRCGSGNEALSTALLIRPDALITDIRMPDMSGLELIKRLTEMLPGVQCVIVSAYSDFDVAREAIRLSAVHYLLKPLSASEVREAAAGLRKKLDAADRPKKEDLSVLTMSMDHPAFPVPPQKGMTCYLTLSPVPFYLPAPDKEKYWHQPVKIGEYTGFLTDYRPEVLPEDVGLSMGEIDCSHPDVMINTALLSYEGGFLFAPASTYQKLPASDIQLYLAEHLTEEITLSGLAARFYLTETYLCDIFKKQTGESIMNFLRHIRLHHAKHLLAYTKFTLREVAAQCGYTDYSYFGRQFKAETGITPDLYRKEKRLSE